MSSYYSAEDVCISTLVVVELLLELKIEQKQGTSLVKLVLSRRKSGVRTERLSVPVILGEYRARIHSEPARGCLTHITSVLCYNNIFIPFIGFLTKFCEFTGNFIIAFGSGIIRCKSIVFERFNYISPIFTSISAIESLFNNININIGTLTT
jgi:hypothetical protein